jgi:hypothetical protein
MSRELETKVQEFAQWYFYHNEETTDVVKRQELQEKALQNLYLLVAMVTHDIRKLEGRDSGLILPGMLR